MTDVVQGLPYGRFLCGLLFGFDEKAGLVPEESAASSKRGGHQKEEDPLEQDQVGAAKRDPPESALRDDREVTPLLLGRRTGSMPAAGDPQTY